MRLLLSSKDWNLGTYLRILGFFISKCMIISTLATFWVLCSCLNLINLLLSIKFKLTKDLAKFFLLIKRVSKSLIERYYLTTSYLWLYIADLTIFIIRYIVPISLRMFLSFSLPFLKLKLTKDLIKSFLLIKNVL